MTSFKGSDFNQPQRVIYEFYFLTSSIFEKKFVKFAESDVADSYISYT